MPAPIVQSHDGKESRGYAPSFFPGGADARINDEHRRCESLVDDIRGKLEPADHLKLYEAAFHAQGPIVEIGRLHGRSTTVMALAARSAGSGTRITSIEVVERFAPWAERHLTERSLVDHVDLVTGDSVETLQRLDADFDVAFVDGDHTFAGVERDIEALMPLMRRGGVVLFHDYYHRANDEGDYGVRQAVDAARDAHRLAFRGRFGGIAMFEVG